MSLVIDLEQWPVVKLGFGRDVTGEEVRTYVDATRAMFRRRQPYVAITWMTVLRNHPHHRQQILDLVKETEEDTRRYAVASAIVNSSTAFRFMMSSINLIRPLPMPVSVVERFEDAEKFVRAEAAKKALVLPAAIAPLPGF